MRFITSACLILLCISVYAQQNPKNELEQRLIRVLENDQILLTAEQRKCEGDCRPNSPWKNNSQRKKAIRNDDQLRAKLLSSFRPPTYIEGKTLDSNLIFRGKTIQKVGSYLIRSNDLSSIENGSEPILPVLSSGSQLSVPDPKDESSSYLLNFTSTALFSLTSSADLEGGFKAFFNAKSSASLGLSNEKRSQVSVGAGVFVNRLAAICNKSKQNLITAPEFIPLQAIWSEYAQQTIKPSDQLILSFQGMAVYSSTGTQSSNTMKFDADLNAKGVVPFLSLSAQNKTSWSRASDLQVASKNYDIYMFAPPTLITLPTAEDIRSNWTTLSAINSKYTATSKLIPADKPLVFTITFGPVASAEVRNLVKIDESYSLKAMGTAPFIKSIRLINDPSRIKFDENTLQYTFDVEVERDENAIAANGSIIQEVISTEFPLRVYIDAPVDGKYLEHIYEKIELQADRYPTPYCTQYDIDGKKEPKGFVYQAKVNFKAPGATQIASTPKPPQVTDVYGLPSAVDHELKSIIKNASIRGGTNNEFDLKFTIPEDKKFFNINHRNYEVELQVAFFASNRQYVRRLPINIVGSPEQYSTQRAASIVIKDNTELLNSLNRTVEIAPGIKISDLLAANTVNGAVDMLKVTEQLKKSNHLSVDAENKYIISQQFISVEKLK